MYMQTIYAEQSVLDSG